MAGQLCEEAESLYPLFCSLQCEKRYARPLKVKLYAIIRRLSPTKSTAGQTVGFTNGDLFVYSNTTAIKFVAGAAEFMILYAGLKVSV